MPARDEPLLNGDFSVWSRLDPGATPQSIPCRTWRQTFAADRWKVRYLRPGGTEITQARSEKRPEQSLAAGSLELCGADGLADPVFVGQRIESAATRNLNGDLTFSIHVLIEGGKDWYSPFRLHVQTPRDPDVFGDVFNSDCDTREMVDFGAVQAGRWVELAAEFEAKDRLPNGLSIELEIPSSALCFPRARVSLSQASLRPVDRESDSGGSPALLERQLQRFARRFDSGNLNSIGRALVVNPHELHFQLRFHEMRCPPSCTLSAESQGLRVFSLDGTPQTGFAYDVTYRSRGSVIIRATKMNHGLADGFLSFVGHEGRILLEAEM